jgi:hypothetical protein
VLWGLILVSPIGYSAPDHYADINGDVLVNNQDISKLSSCFAQNPLHNPDCALVDIDNDGDIDRDDFDFISTRLGHAYPWTLYSLPLMVNKYFVTTALGDMNGDGKLDIVGVDKPIGHHYGNGLTVWLGLGNGRFQKHFYSDEYSSSAVVLGDINADGMLDAVINHRRNEMAVLLGDGEGGFLEHQVFSTNVYSYYNNISLNLRDVNRDGKLDVIASNKLYYGKISVLLGNGDGSFQEPTQVGNYSVDQTIAGIALGKISGDDSLDLVVATENDISVLSGNGDGSFQTPQVVMTNEAISGLSLYDVNQDGRLDILICNTSHHEVLVILNNGQGNFVVDQRITLADRPSSLTLKDLNGDKKLDVLVKHDSQSVSTLLANDDGRFQIHQHLIIPVDVSVGDVNGDDIPDLVSSTILLFGEGDGNFQTPKPNDVLIAMDKDKMTLTDVNGDNKLDLLAIKHRSNNVSVQLGNGDGSFQKRGAFPIEKEPHQIDVGDMNEDGHLDLIVFHDSDRNNISMLLGDGTGGFQAEQRIATDITNSRFILQQTLGDINGDGHFDVVVNGTQVVLGNGDGSFQTPQEIDIGISSSLRSVNDVDGDGVLDLIVLYPDEEDKFGHKGMILLNDGGGNFRTINQFELISDTPTDINNPIEITVYDLNKDGRKDIITRFTTPIDDTTMCRILISTVDGAFLEHSNDCISEERITLLDIDDANGDSIPDIIVGNVRYTFLLLGNGDGSFRNAQYFGISGRVVGDLNGDNRPDILGSTGHYTVVLFNKDALSGR